MDNNLIQDILAKDSCSANEFASVLDFYHCKGIKYFQDLILAATHLPAKHKNNLTPVFRPVPYIEGLNPRLRGADIPWDDSLVYATDDLINWAKNKNFSLPKWQEESVNDLKVTERSKLLEIVLGMAMVGFKYIPNAPRNTATGGNKNSIRAALQQVGLDADEETIKHYLDEAVELLQHKLVDSVKSKPKEAV